MLKLKPNFLILYLISQHKKKAGSFNALDHNLNSLFNTYFLDVELTLCINNYTNNFVLIICNILNIL